MSVRAWVRAYVRARVSELASSAHALIGASLTHVARMMRACYPRRTRHQRAGRLVVAHTFKIGRRAREHAHTLNTSDYLNINNNKNASMLFCWMS